MGRLREKKDLKALIFLGAISLSFSNVLTLIEKGRTISESIPFVAPFLFVVPIALFFKNLKPFAILYGILGIAMTLSALSGEASGSAALMIAMYMWNNEEFVHPLLICTALAIVAKFTLMEEPVSRAFAQMTGYAFFLLSFHVIMKPKKHLPIPDDDTIEIVEHLKSGKKAKEIEDIMNLSYDQIRYKVRKAKRLYGCKGKDDMELYSEMQNRGIVGKNVEKST